MRTMSERVNMNNYFVIYAAAAIVVAFKIPFSNIKHFEEKKTH